MARKAAITLVSDTITRDLKRLGPESVVAIKGVLHDEMTAVADEARPLSPIDPEDGGQLQDSIKATKPVVTRRGFISAGVKAGGGSVKYASIQHEDLSFKHTFGMAKFLERPFKRRLPKIIGRIRATLDAKLARG